MASDARPGPAPVFRDTSMSALAAMILRAPGYRILSGSKNKERGAPAGQAEYARPVPKGMQKRQNVRVSEGKLKVQVPAPALGESSMSALAAMISRAPGYRISGSKYMERSAPAGQAEYSRSVPKGMQKRERAPVGEGKLRVQVPAACVTRRLESITTLLGNKVDGSNTQQPEFVFELGVEVEGEGAPILSKSEGLSDCSQAWIKSEVGKHYSVNVKTTQTNANVDNSKISYPDMEVTCYIDGVYVGGKLIGGDGMKRSKGVEVVFEGRRKTATEMRKFQFAAPTLTEASTPGFDASQVGTISIVFQRCKRGIKRMVPRAIREDDPSAGSPALAGAINEKMKKTTIVGSVTAYGDSVPIPFTEKMVSDYKTRPGDEKKPFYGMRLRYATEDILKAEGHIPMSLKPNIMQGEPGLMARHPIDLDDGDNDLGSPSVKREVRTGFAVAAGECSRSAAERSAAIEREIAEIQAKREERLRLDREDEERIKRLREESSSEDIKPVTGKRPISDSDVKPNLGAGAKRCKVDVKEEEEDGIMILTIKDEDE